MIATAPQPQTTPAPKPSIAKHGTVVNEDGFTQVPRSLEDYLNSINICSTAILLVFILLSYRWTAEQESFPSVKTLAKRCGVSTRRLNQLTKQLCELGLLIKTERFAGRSQISNYYDLEPLYEKVAAWKNAEVAAALAEEEALADIEFEPQGVLEQAAQVISEEFGEPSPRQQRYNARRLERRWTQHQLAWPDFANIVEKAAAQTEERKAEPTRTGKAFVKLVPYFFSALDYWLSKAEPAPQQSTTSTRSNQNKEQHQAQAHTTKSSQAQPAKKSGVLAERARARKEAEAAGSAKVRAPETLRVKIEAAALTFRDKAVKSSVQRAANLMADALLDELTMCEMIADARAETSAATRVKARMPYFFQRLEEKVSKYAENRV